MSRFIVVMLLVVPAVASAQQCDPAGPRLPSWQFSDVPLELELFKDELRARGTCSWASVSQADWRATEVELLMRDTEARAAALRCDGVCEPMRGKLPALDEAHDLEDSTFQTECRAATGVLPPEHRDPCLRVCVVERRQFASRAVFARTIRGLEQTRPGSKGARGDEKTIRKLLKQNAQSAPPTSIRFVTINGKNDRFLRAEGWLYPGGPRLRLETGLQSAGCGLTAWGISTW